MCSVRLGEIPVQFQGSGHFHLGSLMVRLGIDTRVASEQFMAICETSVSEGEFCVLFDRLGKVFCCLVDVLYTSLAQMIPAMQVEVVRLCAFGWLSLNPVDLRGQDLDSECV